MPDVAASQEQLADLVDAVEMIHSVEVYVFLVVVAAGVGMEEEGSLHRTYEEGRPESRRGIVEEKFDLQVGRIVGLKIAAHLVDIVDTREMRSQAGVGMHLEAAGMVRRVARTEVDS